MSEHFEVSREGDYIDMSTPMGAIEIHVDHIEEFIKAIFAAITGRPFTGKTET